MTQTNFFVTDVDAAATTVGMGARFSPDRVYRYALWRTWDTSKPRMMVIGLNPSTADETLDDPTIRRCLGFARRDGYGGLSMLNLYGFRSTDPHLMVELSTRRVIPNAVGPENDRYLAAFAATSAIIVCAWGTFGFVDDRAAHVCAMLTTLGATLSCFGTNREGRPRHPLYLSNLTPIIPYVR